MGTRHQRKHRLNVAAAGLLAASALVATPARAVEPFTLVKDAYPEPVGQWELEFVQDAFWHPKEDHNAREFGTEVEFERGINEKLALSVFGEVSYVDNADVEGLHFEAGGVGGQYIFASPATEPLGVGLIGEIGIGERGDVSAELFLALQKDLDKWVFAYNLGFETGFGRAFGSGDRETEGVLINSAGAEYALTPQLYAGVEGSLEMIYSEWRKYDDMVMYAGPVLYWTPTDDFYLTVGFDFQITDVDEESQYRAAVIAGYYF